MYNVLKFQAPFDRIKEYNSCPTVCLNKAVIIQALTDASSFSSKSNTASKIANKAKNWALNKENEDHFRDVCERAELDYTLVRQIIKQGIALSLHKHKSLEQKIMYKLHNILIKTKYKKTQSY